MYCIYVFSDEDGIPVYVGKTKNLTRRIKEHLKDRKRKNCLFYKWLNKQIREDKAYYVDILEECNDENWQEKEKYWIKHVKENNFPLKNMTEGGEGSKIYKRVNNLNCNFDIFKKPILQYDLDGNFVKEFTCVKDAANSVNTSTTCISRVAKGKGKYANRFQWRYKTDNYPLKIEKCLSKLKEVYQYDLNNNLLKIWESSCDIEKFFNLRKDKIQEIIKKKKPILNNFIWKNN